MSEETKPGGMDDDAIRRAKKNAADKKKQLQDIFDDNTSKRYGSSTDK